VKMTRFTDSERQRIEAAITAAELRTRVEFVVVAARRTGFYSGYRLLAAILLSFGGSFLLWANGAVVQFPAALAVQIGLLATGLALASSDRFTAWAVPDAARRERTRQAARAAFVDMGLHDLPEARAVLVFVARAERCIEIVADSGAHVAAPASAWPDVVDAFVAKAGSGDLPGGVCAAIECIAAHMSGPMPRRFGDTNALPDRLIEIG